MVTVEEKILKLEAEARHAVYLAEKNAADVEYIAMMSDIEIDEEESTNEQEV